MNLNYYNTFITVSSDCPATSGQVPTSRKEGKTKPMIEFELIAPKPYMYTQEDILFETHVRHKGISDDEVAEHGTRLRDEFFQRSHACMRASMLPKKFGWGIHFNEEGKAALYGVDTPEYKQFVTNSDGRLHVVPAMRSSRSN